MKVEGQIHFQNKVTFGGYPMYLLRNRWLPGSVRVCLLKVDNYVHCCCDYSRGHSFILSKSWKQDSRGHRLFSAAMQKFTFLLEVLCFTSGKLPPPFTTSVAWARLSNRRDLDFTHSLTASWFPRVSEP